MATPHKRVIDAIKACHATEDELYLLMEEVCEGTPTPDQAANLISGIMELNKLRINKVKREYELTITNSNME